MERRAALGYAFAVFVALTLQGCEHKPPPPASCYEMEFKDGRVPPANLGEAGTPECDPGYAYVGPDMTCNLVNRECLIEDPESCRNVHGFGPAGQGLTSFPSVASPVLVTEFTHTWTDYLRAQRGEAAGDLRDYARQRANFYLGEAERARDKVRELEEAIESEYQEAKTKAKQAYEGAKTMTIETFQDIYDLAFNAAVEAREQSLEALGLAQKAKRKADELRQNVVDGVEGVTQAMVDEADRAASAAGASAEAMARRAEETWIEVQGAYRAALDAFSPDTLRQYIHEATAPEAPPRYATGLLLEPHGSTAPSTARRLADAEVPAKTYSSMELLTSCQPLVGDASRLYLRLPPVLRSAGLGPQLPVALGALGVIGCALVAGRRTMHGSTRGVEVAEAEEAEFGRGSAE